MTTVVASRAWIASDTFITYDPSFVGEPKIWTADGSAWGAAGSANLCNLFKAWTYKRGKKPECKKKELEVLQLRGNGELRLWCGDDLPLMVAEEFYAIGSGAGYALGALCMGADPLKALEVAAKWSPNTRLPGHLIEISDIPKKRRKRG